MNPVTYGRVLASYVGISILLSYVTSARWYDSARQLGIIVPFHLDFTESAIRGSLVGAFASICVLLMFYRFRKSGRRHQTANASWLLLVYSLAVGFSVLTEPHAYDPALIIELVIPGVTAVASTFLWASNLALQSERISQRDVVLKWIGFEHTETIEAIRTVTLLVFSTIAVTGYNSLFGFWPAVWAKYGDTNSVLLWQSFGLMLLNFTFVATGFAIFTISPLLLRLEVLKVKLKQIKR